MATYVISAAGTVTINGVTHEIEDLVVCVKGSLSRAARNSVEVLFEMSHSRTYEDAAERWLQRLHPAEHSAVLLQCEPVLVKRINRAARQLGFITKAKWTDIRKGRDDRLRPDPCIVEVPVGKYKTLHERAMRETRGSYQRTLVANKIAWTSDGSMGHYSSRSELSVRLVKRGYRVIDYQGVPRLAWKSPDGTFYTWVQTCSE